MVFQKIFGSKTRNKMILTIAVILMIMILIVTSVLYSMSAAALRRQTREALIEQTMYAGWNLDTYLRDYENLLLSMRISQSLHKMISETEFDDYLDFSTHFFELSSYLRSGASECAYVPRLTLYLCPTYPYDIPPNELVRPASVVEETQWYTEAIDSHRSQIIWDCFPVEPYPGVQTMMLSATLPVTDRSNGNLLAVARLEQEIKWIIPAFENSIDLEHGNLYVTNDQGELLFCVENGMLSNMAAQDEFFQLRSLAAGEVSKSTDDELLQNTFQTHDTKRDWQIIYMADSKRIVAHSLFLGQRILLFLMPVIFAALLLVIFVSDVMTRRLLRLTKAVNAVNEQNLTIQFQDNGNDEVSSLYHAFEHLLLTARELIDKNQLVEREKYAIELQTLQEQIAPHFLYNTLSSINSMALDIEAEDISQAVLALAGFYRLSLSNGAGVVPLKTERDLLLYYIQICEIRFADKIQISLEFEESILDCQTPKLIIQPFVENALMHGISDNIPLPCHVSIRVFGDGKTIRISIEDDGVGIPPETLKRLQSESYNPQKHHAIENIRHRIQLLYGNGYGVQIHSVVNEGTRVDILLPQIPIDSDT